MIETYDITRDALRDLRVPDVSSFRYGWGDWLLVQYLGGSAADWEDAPVHRIAIVAHKPTYRQAVGALHWYQNSDQKHFDYEIWHVVPTEDEVLEALRQLRLAAEVI